MTNGTYEVDQELYQKALEEIKQDFLSANRLDPATEAMMAGSIAAHAQNSFYTMWTSAIRSHESHKESRAQTADMFLDPLDETRLKQLSEEDRARFRKLHEESVAQYKRDNEQRQRIFDNHHRKMLIITMTSAGMSEETATEIVEKHILTQ